MFYFRHAIPLFLALITLSANIDAKTENPVLTPTEAQSLTNVDIVQKLSTRHYRNLVINDALSEEFLANYLKTLDPSKLYFLQADIDNFNKHKTDFDDFIRKGDLKPGFEIYRIFKDKLTSRLDWVLTRLQSPETNFSFTGTETVELERKDAAWAKTEQELDKLWLKHLQLNVLDLKLGGKTLAEAKTTLERRYKNQIKRLSQETSQDVFDIYINAFTILYDPHTNYFSPRTSENFNINMSLQLEGIGAELKTEDEYTKVARLVAGGPADKQGQLKAADKIIGVGQGKEGEIVDVVGWRLDEVVDLIRGKKESIVRLQVLTAQTEPKIIEIKRGTVKLENQAAQKAVLKIGEGENQRKVGVIDIPAFYQDFDAYRRGDQDFRSTTRDVARLLRELQQEGVEGIVLDLRNNGGGSLQEATMLTDLFIDPGPVVQIRESNGSISQQNRSRSPALYRGPLVVLVNRLSASASEIFAGAIQDYNRGLIVGSQSFGKGTVQLLSELPEGQLKLTESKFYRVSGDSTQHRGVIPDIDLPALVDTKEVGESAYETALTWDKIPPANHAHYFDFTSMLPVLQNRHKTRSSKNPDIVKIVDQLSLMEQNKSRKTLSLNEALRIKEKADLELAQMNIENKKRVAKALKPFPDLKAYRDYEKEEEKKLEQAASETKPSIDVERDALLNETGNILIDMIDLSKTSQPQVANFK